MNRRRSVRLSLPELSPREALVLSYLLDALDTELWRLYGTEMQRICEEEPIPPFDAPPLT